MGKIPKDIKGHLFPTVGVHSQNEEYVLSFSSVGFVSVNRFCTSTYAMRFFCRVSVNFGKKKFVFDVQVKRNVLLNLISRVSSFYNQE